MKGSTVLGQFFLILQFSTFTAHWPNSADEMDICLNFPRKQDLIVLLIVSIGDNLHGISKPVF